MNADNNNSVECVKEANDIFSYRQIEERDILDKIGEKENLTPKDNLTYKSMNFIQISDKILDLVKLEENWDGYGANKINFSTITNAYHLINTIDDKYLEQLDINYIYPDPNGSISLEWENGDYYLIIELGKNTLSFVAVLPNNEKYRLNSVDFPTQKLSNEIGVSFEKLFAQNFN